MSRYPCFSGVASSSWFAWDTESSASQANPGQLVTLHFRDEDAESPKRFVAFSNFSYEFKSKSIRRMEPISVFTGQIGTLEKVGVSRAVW